MKYTVALVGCGKIGFLNDKGEKNDLPRTHFSNFYYSPFFKLIAIVDPMREIRDYISETFGVPAFDNVEEMMSSVPCPEVICIASPDHSHEYLLHFFLSFRPSLVLCEKPLSLNNDLPAVTELVNKYNEKKIELVVNFTRRFLNEFHTLKEWIDKGVLGRLQILSIYYSRGLIHNGSHYLDLILWFFGEPVWMKVISKKPGLHQNDPTVNVILGYPDGFEVYLIGIETSQVIVNEIDLIGSNKRIQISTEGMMDIFELGKKENYPEYLFFEVTERKPLNYSLAFVQIAENIKNFLSFGKPLISEASNCIRLYKLINQIIDQIHE